MRFRQAALDARRQQAVAQSIEIIRRRIDQLGTREPNIFRQGSNRIVIQAPGESDPERLKNVIGQTAKLTFQMVDDSVTVAEAMSGRVPPGSELLPAVEGPGDAPTAITPPSSTNEEPDWGPSTPGFPVPDSSHPWLFTVGGVGVLGAAVAVGGGVRRRSRGRIS